MKWTILLILVPLFGIAQQNAFFETTIYFEDAIGNKDSVIVGHDENANHYYNPEFGEMDIVEPWDSVFEVRAAHYLDFSSPDGELVLSKKIIGSNEGGIHPTFGCLMANEPIVLFVNVKNLPLSVSWDQNSFANSICLNRSTLTSHLWPMILYDWWFDEALMNSACLAEIESFQFNKFDIGGVGFYLIDEIENNAVDTMVALLLNFRFQNAVDSPCSATVSTVNISKEYRGMSIYPNPAFNQIRIESDAYDYWIIINQESKLIKKGRSKSINIENFQSGIYYLSFFDADGRLLQIGKFIKME